MKRKEFKTVWREDEDGDSVVDIIYKDEVVYTWHDHAHIDYPEDSDNYFYS